MKKQKKIQLILLFVGVFLFASTYLFYPSINNKDKTLDYIANNETKKNIDTSSSSSFENLEYKGMYNFTQPFTITSKEAYILNDQPNIVYMKKMHVKLFLIDGRVISITSDKGKYNKETLLLFKEAVFKFGNSTTLTFKPLAGLFTQFFALTFPAQTPSITLYHILSSL